MASETFIVLLREAISNNDAKTVWKLCSSHPLEINERQGQDQTALLLSAAKTKNAEIIEALLTKGFKINKKDKDSRRILLWEAYKNEDLKTIELLVSHATVNVDLKVEGPEYGRPILQLAIHSNNIRLIDVLLKYRIDVNALWCDNKTPLHHAVEKGNLEIVQKLLERKADVNAANRWNQTVLYRAAEYGFTEIVELLLKKNAKVNVKCNFNNSTALDIAVRESKKEVVEMIINQGADVDCIIVNSDFLLPRAVSKGWLETVRLLLDHGANINNCRYENPLSEAIYSRNDEMVELLLNNGISVNGKSSSDSTPLYRAIEKKNLNLAKRLLNCGADVNDLGGYQKITLPLNYAIQFCDIEFTELLINYGADVNSKSKDGNTPLITAIQKECISTVELLLKHGANIHSKCGLATPLGQAVRRDCKIAMLLLQRGIDTNAKSDWYTPLGSAIERKNLELINCLLAKKGINVDGPCRFDKISPFQICIVKNLPELADVLLKSGADINFQDKIGKTALHHATKRGDTEMVKFLLERGAAVDVPNKFGSTALHEAIYSKNNSTIVKLLLDFNANINNACKRGETPLDVIISKEMAIKEIFIKHIIKLQREKLPVSDHNLQLIDKNEEFKNLYDTFNKEFEQLKGEENDFYNQKVLISYTIHSVNDEDSKNVILSNDFAQQVLRMK